MDCLNDFVELFNDDNTDIVDAALFCTFSYKIPELIPSYKNLRKNMAMPPKMAFRVL